MEPAKPAKATVFQLVFMTYAVICSGAYGLEEMISGTGPGLALTALLALPLLYAAPISMACSELSARHPVEGGYYRWVRMAFGDAVGYAAGWLCGSRCSRPMRPSRSSSGTTSATSSRSLAGHPVRYRGRPHLGATLLNVRGIQLVGRASVVLTILILLPFVGLTGLGLLRWRFNPFVPFLHPEKTPLAAMGAGFAVAMWIYGGFEKLTVSAEEVENPRRAFPIALAIAVPACALSYILPTLAALAANGDWRDWSESYFATAALKVGGPFLGAAMAAGGLVSNACILLVTILAQSRLPMVLADDGMFPRSFARTHPRYGTPGSAARIPADAKL